MNEMTDSTRKDNWDEPEKPDRSDRFIRVHRIRGQPACAVNRCPKNAGSARMNTTRRYPAGHLIVLPFFYRPIAVHRFPSSETSPASTILPSRNRMIRWK